MIVWQGFMLITGTKLRADWAKESVSIKKINSRVLEEGRGAIFIVDFIKLLLSPVPMALIKTRFQKCLTY